MAERRFKRANAMMALAIAGVLGLAGCGGIEFESKLLDNIGVGGLIGNGKHQEEQKLETRSALIVPPSVEQLPTPGGAAPTQQSFPQNPETVEAAQKRAAEAKRKAECDESNGEFGSRQSGQHSDQETPATENKTDCGSPIRDYLGNQL